MSTILITGGSGLIGTALTPRLTAAGHKVIILSRGAKNAADSQVSYARWDVEAGTIDKNAVLAADYIIHLAGAGVAEKRWTKQRKKEIVESRTKSGALLVKALRELPHKVQAVASASAIGWYGADENRPAGKKAFTENMRADKDFLGDTCRLWEESIEPVTALGVRLVKIRIGIVLANEGGALPEFKKPVRFGIAGVLGSGKQVISWIHIADLCRMFLHAVDSPELQGVYNGVAPAPVTNKELTLLLAHKMKGRFFVHMHVPAFLLKLALGELSIEVLKSATVSGSKILDAGFYFTYPTIETALDELVKGVKR